MHQKTDQKKTLRSITKKIVDFQRDNEGELIYESPSSGYFLISHFSIEKPFATKFFDCPITIKNIKNCYVSNLNLLHTESTVFANSSYHFETPPVDIKQYGLEADVMISCPDCIHQYPILQDYTYVDTGFYIGDTDNFGHWVFEFLPKVLWYTRLFPKQDIPLIIGKSVPRKWLDLLLPLGINLEKLFRFDSGKSYKYNNLIVCSASIKRMQGCSGAIRSEDFMTLRYLVENHYRHISYSNRLDCLFCTRQNARWRKIINEEEVIAWLKQNFNTETFEPENLSIGEQLTMLGKTKLFFGNGGSTPFSMFQPKDSYLFEIRGPGGGGIVGRSWPDLFRFGYHLVKTEFENQPENFNFESESDASYHHRNLKIDFIQFKKDVIRSLNLSGLFKGRKVIF